MDVFVVLIYQICEIVTGISVIVMIVPSGSVSWQPCVFSTAVSEAGHFCGFVAITAWLVALPIIVATGYTWQCLWTTLLITKITASPQSHYFPN